MKNNTLQPLSLTTLRVRPDVLAESAKHAVREILAQASSANTTRSYASAVRYWAAWFQGRYGQAFQLPVPEAAVVQFIVDHLKRKTAAGSAWELPTALDNALVTTGLKKRPGVFTLSTIVHRVAVLSSVHRIHGVGNPCEATSVRHLLARSRRAGVKQGTRPRKKTAITSIEMAAMLATCDDSLEGIRDRALLYFGFASGGRRRSEIASATMANLRPAPEGGYVFWLGHSKTQQAGPSAHATPDKPVVGAAGQALQRWIEAAGISEGPVFRRLWKQRVGSGLSPKSIASIIQRRAALAGLEGDFGGHSLRSGFITEGGRRGVALPALMAMTDHRAVASVVGYFQAGTSMHNPAARMLDDVELPRSIEPITETTS